MCGPVHYNVNVQVWTSTSIGLVHYAAIYKQLYSTNLHSPHSNVDVHGYGYPSLDTHVVGTMTRPGTLYI